MSVLGSRTRGVRYREDTGFEMFCEDCKKKGHGQQFWPLTKEFWDVTHGLARCKACWAQKKRDDERTRKRAAPDYIKKRNHAYWLANKDVINLKRNDRRAKAREAAALPALGSPVPAEDRGEDRGAMLG